MDVHTLYLAALVSQATFALTLTLLAWSDRRTKGVLWLAGACAFQFCWTATRGLASDVPSRATEGMAGCLVVVLFFMLYMGFRWFVMRRGFSSTRGPIAVGAMVVLIAGIAIFNAEVAAMLARVTALVLGVMTVAMLWRTKITALRPTARVCALLLVSVMSIMVLRLVSQQPFERWKGYGNEPALTIYAREFTVAVVTLLSFSFIAMFVGEANRRLHEETRIDILTGLRNRRAMEEAAMREVGFAVQNKMPLALLMMDIDRFKNLNDTMGHALGDRALRELGGVLQKSAGARDFTARMGGEEFAVLLPGRDMETAARIAERLRTKVAELHWCEGEQCTGLTVSIGVSVLRDGEEGWTEMLCRADDALYQAKRDGRDRVAVCAIGPSPMTPEREAGRREWRGSRWLPKPGPML